MEGGGRTRALNTQLESRAGLSATKVIKAPARTPVGVERDGVLAFLRDKRHGLKIDPPLSLFG